MYIVTVLWYIGVSQHKQTKPKVLCSSAYYTDVPLPANIKLKAMPNSAENNIWSRETKVGEQHPQIYHCLTNYM